MSGKKNEPTEIKTVRQWSPKPVIMKMAQRQPLNIVNIKSQKKTNLEPEGNSDVQYSEETASPDIELKGKGPCYYCNGENVYQRAVVKSALDVSGMMVTRFVRYAHIKFLLIVNTRSVDGFICCADCHAVKHIDSETLKKTH